MAQIEMVTLKIQAPRFREIDTKGGGTLKIDRSKYPENATAYLFDYGEKQSLNDCVSQEKENKDLPEKKRTPELKDRCLDIIVKRLTNLYEGILPRGGGGRRSSLGPVWEQAAKLIRDNGAEVKVKDFKAALAKASDDKERLTLLVDMVGMPIAVRAKGRNATKALAQKAVVNLFKRATEAAKQAEENAKDLI